MSFSAQPSFSVTRFKPGYDMGEVDAFIAGIADRTFQEMNDVVFKTTRFSPGYDEQEVDAYLDSCIARKRQNPSAQ
jgi:DivIVA domain-containing protein